jgi:hypothetical protein
VTLSVKFRNLIPSRIRAAWACLLGRTVVFRADITGTVWVVDPAFIAENHWRVTLT